MAVRNRKEQMAYKRHAKTRPKGVCSFCAIVPDHKEFVEEGTYFKVITNPFKYTLWDEQVVTDQLMLVPKKHVESISELPVAAAEEYLKFLGEYDKKGFASYSRATGNFAKTMQHQHTHLIKTVGKRKNVILFTRKPYIRIVR